MYGALLGDMIGAPYEFDRGNKSKEFPLFCENSHFTDDSVMTIAVAEALLDSRFLDDDSIRAALIKSMRKWGKKYPDAGYGRKFLCWLREKEPKPYGSCGNGSAMRVSAAGWLFDTLKETREKARLTAEVTHDHPEGIKGAEATSGAIFLARTGRSKEEIRDYIVQEFGYDLSRTCDQIRPSYYHNESCQKTVPEAITAFLEGTDFEDVIRTAVSLGGDCDTLTCIAGSIAEAFYGVPAILKQSAGADSRRTWRIFSAALIFPGNTVTTIFPAITSPAAVSSMRRSTAAARPAAKRIGLAFSMGCSEMPGGIIIDPRGQSFLLTKDRINMILNADKGGQAQ